MPTDRRTSESLMPAAARASASIDACVIVAGCAMRLSTPPSDSASVKHREVSRETFDADAVPPATSKLTIAPKPDCCDRAIVVAGMRREPGIVHARPPRDGRAERFDDGRARSRGARACATCSVRTPRSVR